MSEKICIHCYISGRVQGVWFRASTKTKAEALGLSGWVRNLEDGRVEVMASGEKTALLQLASWLQRGPELAQVEKMDYIELPWQEFEGFKTL